MNLGFIPTRRSDFPQKEQILIQETFGEDFIVSVDINLVGGFNPSEKYALQIGNLPQVGMFFF